MVMMTMIQRANYRTERSKDVKSSGSQRQQNLKATPRKSSIRKRLGSKPILKKSLQKLTMKVLRKREPKEGHRSVDEDSYPRARRSKKVKDVKKTQKIETFVPKIDAAFLLPETMNAGIEVAETSVEPAVRPTMNTLPNTGLPIVKGNNDNNGIIIVKGQPFWASEVPIDDSDVESIMNAAVLVEVLQNRPKLVPMPDIEIDFDPMKETEELASQDKLCFTKDVLFGNTVRTMVNLNGDSNILELLMNAICLWH
uniref:BLVR domain-containing protein n=1 Tax=Angiostrongylus cantonensis TaxID=6313 RepID=A0A0K0DLI8_ANGCA